LSGVVVAVEGPGRSGVGQDLPSGLCVASGMAGVPRRTDAVQGGGPWIAVLAGQAGGIPGPLNTVALEHGQDLELPKAVGQDGEGAELVAADGQKSQYRSAIRATTPASIRRAFRIPTRRLLLSTIAGWLDHGCSIGCLLPAADVRSAWFLPSCSALEQGHHSHRDWDPPGLPTPTAGPISGDLHTGRAGGAGRLALDPVLVSSPRPARTRSRAGRNPDAAQQMEADLHSDGSRRRAAELAWTVRNSICI
jgi:hypothetical protein